MSIIYLVSQQVAVIAELGTLVALLVFAMLAGAFTIRNLIYICGPNEVLIFSGRKRRVLDREVGYRTVKGGRGIRIPLLETVNRLDLTNMNIDVSVRGAYSKGGIPLNVQAVANVKVAGDEPSIHNAIERLLPKNRDDIMKIAKETLEGNLRGVLATLTPEEVNEDKLKFAESLTEEAGEDLAKLGLALDSLKIQNVTDDQGYLAAIGRTQSADLEARARIAEARARAESDIQEALNFERTRLRQVGEELKVIRAEAERRIVDAETMRAAVVREQQGEVEALIARAEAEVKVQGARIEQVERQLRAELIEPWMARRDAMQSEARGRAARIVEDGRARANALRQLADAWKAQGGDAKSVLLLQKLERIVELMTATMPQLDIANMTMIDSAASDAADNGTLPVRAISAIEQIRRATGVDLEEISSAISRKKNEES